MAIFRYCGTYSQTVGHAGSTTGIVHADMTLTRSKVKVEVFELPKISEGVHAGGDDRQSHSGAFLTWNQRTASEMK